MQLVGCVGILAFRFGCYFVSVYKHCGESISCIFLKSFTCERLRSGSPRSEPI